MALKHYPAFILICFSNIFLVKSLQNQAKVCSDGNPGADLLPGVRAQVLLWVQCPRSAAGCQVKSCCPNISHMSPQQHCKALAVSYQQKHCINLHLNKHFCGTFELFTGKVLCTVIGLIVLFCFIECGWENNGYGWITSRRQLRRTTTNWGFLTRGGIAGSNQIPRKEAPPCAALLERWVIPILYPAIFKWQRWAGTQKRIYQHSQIGFEMLEICFGIIKSFLIICFLLQ